MPPPRAELSRPGIRSWRSFSTTLNNGGSRHRTEAARESIVGRPGKCDLSLCDRGVALRPRLWSHRTEIEAAACSARATTAMKVRGPSASKQHVEVSFMNGE